MSEKFPAQGRGDLVLSLNLLIYKYLINTFLARVTTSVTIKQRHFAVLLMGRLVIISAKLVGNKSFLSFT